MPTSSLPDLKHTARTKREASAAEAGNYCCQGPSCPSVTADKLNSLVGRNIEVYTKSTHSYLPAVVYSFDGETGRHEVRYEGGTAAKLDLEIETYRLIVCCLCLTGSPNDAVATPCCNSVFCRSCIMKLWTAPTIDIASAANKRTCPCCQELVRVLKSVKSAPCHVQPQTGFDISVRKNRDGHKDRCAMKMVHKKKFRIQEDCTAEALSQCKFESSSLMPNAELNSPCLPTSQADEHENKSRFLGHRVAKQFLVGRKRSHWKTYRGTIANIVPPLHSSDNSHHGDIDDWFLIEYDDGDKEHVGWHELQEMLEFFRQVGEQLPSKTVYADASSHSVHKKSLKEPDRQLSVNGENVHSERLMERHTKCGRKRKGIDTGIYQHERTTASKEPRSLQTNGAESFSHAGLTSNVTTDGDVYLGPNKSFNECILEPERVLRPAHDTLSWQNEDLSPIEQRSNIRAGHRVKVNFGRDGWYGGVISQTVNNGYNVHINYDDGSKEFSSFPDTDIIVDDKQNGCHEVRAGTFLPPSQRKDSLMGEELEVMWGFRRARRRPTFLVADENQRLDSCKVSAKRGVARTTRRKQRNDSLITKPVKSSKVPAGATQPVQIDNKAVPVLSRVANGHKSKHHIQCLTPDDELDGGWPPGWKKHVVRRWTSMGMKKDCSWYSPKQSLKFRSMVEVRQFLQALSETAGDESSAWTIFKSSK